MPGNSESGRCGTARGIAAGASRRSAKHRCKCGTTNGVSSRTSIEAAWSESVIRERRVWKHNFSEHIYKSQTTCDRIADRVRLTLRELGRPRGKFRMWPTEEKDVRRLEFEGVSGWLVSLHGYCEQERTKFPEVKCKVFLKDPIDSRKICERLNRAKNNLRCSCEWHTRRRERRDYFRSRPGRPRRRVWIRTVGEHVILTSWRHVA